MSQTINLLGDPAQVQFSEPSNGIMQRSNPKSIFMNFRKNSSLELSLFRYDGSIPFFNDGSMNVQVTILQVAIFDDKYMVEIIRNSDYMPEVEQPQM